MDWFLYDNGLRHERVKVPLIKVYTTLYRLYKSNEFGMLFKNSETRCKQKAELFLGTRPQTSGKLDSCFWFLRKNIKANLQLHLRNYIYNYFHLKISSKIFATVFSHRSL